jgi:hypothetical protein
MTSTVGGPAGSCERAVVHSSPTTYRRRGSARSCSFNSATAYRHYHYHKRITIRAIYVTGVFAVVVTRYLNVIFQSY